MDPQVIMMIARAAWSTINPDDWKYARPDIQSHLIDLARSALEIFGSENLAIASTRGVMVNTRIGVDTKWVEKIILSLPPKGQGHVESSSEPPSLDDLPTM